MRTQTLCNALNLLSRRVLWEWIYDSVCPTPSSCPFSHVPLSGLLLLMLNLLPLRSKVPLISQAIRIINTRSRTNNNKNNNK